MKKKRNTKINFSRIHPIKTVLRIEWLSFVYILYLQKIAKRKLSHQNTRRANI